MPLKNQILVSGELVVMGSQMDQSHQDRPGEAELLRRRRRTMIVRLSSVVEAVRAC